MKAETIHDPSAREQFETGLVLYSWGLISGILLCGLIAMIVGP